MSIDHKRWHACRPRSWLLALALGAAALGAQADVVRHVQDGTLMGASGVMVNGASYTVEFIDGTCAAVFSGCNPGSDDFEFKTRADAEAAARALAFTVLLDIDGHLFDTKPSLTNGCRRDDCDIITPWIVQPFPAEYATRGAYFLNQNFDDSRDLFYSSFVHGNFDSSESDTKTWARWALEVQEPPASVPEPSSLALLMLAGLALPLARTRRRRSSAA